jgi:drug/metabolite transporter (DMT)-like permease
MFIGEMGCWLVVGLTFLYRQYIAPRLSSDSSPLLAGGYHPINGNADEEDNADDSRHPKPLHEEDDRIPLRGWKVFLLAAPSSCDIAGTTLMNVGLLFVAASIYQMTRGALVLFVGLFSVLFLHRKLYLYQWSALFVVVLGVAIVGLSGALFSGETGHDVTNAKRALVHARAVARTPEAVQAVIGVLLIAAAQIFTASQFVLEEWILEHYAMDPIRVVGWEGVFGFLVTLVGMVVMYAVVGSTDAGRYGYFDIGEGWREITSNRAIATSSLLIMISIGYVFLDFFLIYRLMITVALTSSVCRLLGLSLPLRVARSIRAGRFSFGLFRLVWAGNLSSGSRLLASRFLSMEPFCSIISSRLLLRLACLASTGREKCCYPKTPLSISDCLNGFLALFFDVPAALASGLSRYAGAGLVPWILD